MTNLPESSESHTQERKSLNKLQTLLPPDKFIVREETGGDYGADRIVELIVNGREVSNYRFQAQCKSARQLEPNEDGTHSYSVPIKTVKYLINQPNSILFLHLQDVDVMKWVWVEEVWREANARGINLDETIQEEITCRFSRELNNESIVQIYQKILERGQILRRTSELIALSSPDSPPEILINLAKGTVVDLSQLADLLRKYGFFLINSGQLNLLEQIISQLPNSLREDIEISYVISYAKLLLGKNWEALSWLPKGAKEENAPLAFRQIGVIIGATAEHAIGMKTRQQYEEAVEEARRMDSGSIMSIQIELQTVRSISMFQLLNRQGEWLTKFREVADKLRKHPGATPAIKALADIYEWELEGIAASVKALEEITRAEMSRKMNFTSIEQKAAIVQNQLTILKEWLEKEKDLRQSLDTSNLDLIHGLIPFTRASILFQFIHTFRSIAKEFDVKQYFSDKMLVQLAEDLEKTAQFMEHLKYFDLAVRCHLVRAEILALAGNLEDSKTAGKAAYQLASEIGAERFRKDAEEAIEGRTLIQTFISHTQELQGMDQDLLVAEMPIEGIKQFAVDVVESLAISKERLPVVQRSVEAMLAGARVRRDFCRHLKLQEDLTHTRDPRTLFAKDPNRVCMCDLFGYKSKIELPEWESVINAFKKAYCSGCDKREPLVPEKTPTAPHS